MNKNESRKIKNLTKYNINQLETRILGACNSLTSQELNSYFRKLNSNTLILGVGGSGVVSHFAKRILTNKNDIVVKSLNVLDIYEEPLVLYQNVVAFTYGNKNHGITKALKEGKKNNLNTYIVTHSDKTSKQHNIISYNSDVDSEYSFISIASTLAPMTLMLKYYLSIDGREFEQLIQTILKDKSIPEIKLNNQNFEIMSCAKTKSAEVLLETTMTEAGIGIPIIHNKYEYCHGRSTLSHHYSTNLIYLINGEPSELDKLLLELLKPYYEHIYIIHVNNYQDKIINEFALTYKCLLFCHQLAAKKDMELSRVNYCRPIVKTAYYYNGEFV